MAEKETASNTLGYHHLGIVCTDIATSVEFYTKLGFHVRTKDETKAVLYNDAGLELHLFKTTNAKKTDEGKPFNVLMDDTTTKYPGHTHFCMGVGSVARTREYLKSVGLEESGQREMFGYVASVFMRDPDRTTVELERNDGKDDGIDVTFDILSNPPRKGIDHVGTRVCNVPAKAPWYRQHLGLTKDIMVNEVDMEHPIRNGRPWILRTTPVELEAAVDINLIPNGTTETPMNILIEADKDPLPGIFYTCYQVASIEEAIQGLDAQYVANTTEELMAWGVSESKFVNAVGQKSCFVRDWDHNLFRLVEV